MYEDLNDDDPSVMHVSAVPHSEVLAVQGQCSPHENNLGGNQMQDMSACRLNWKANLECTYTDSSAIAQKQQPPIVNTQQANYTGQTSFFNYKPHVFPNYNC